MLSNRARAKAFPSTPIAEYQSYPAMHREVTQLSENDCESGAVGQWNRFTMSWVVQHVEDRRADLYGDDWSAALTAHVSN